MTHGRLLLPLMMSECAVRLDHLTVQSDNITRGSAKPKRCLNRSEKSEGGTRKWEVEMQIAD